MDQPNDFIKETKLPGVFIIERPTYEDPRGFFREFYRKNDLENRLGFEFNPVQANHSHSAKDTLRGIHIATWHKMVTAAYGQVQQIVVDFRKDSPTFGQYESIIMGGDRRNAVLVPAGCGNAFLALTEQTDYIYLASDYWEPGKEQYAIYNDPDLNIEWLTKTPLVSENDLKNKTVKELFPEHYN